MIWDRPEDYKNEPVAIFTIGAPRCGKTTWAQAWMLRYPGYIHIAMDDIREMIAGSKAAFWRADDDFENRQAVLNATFDHAYNAARSMRMDMLFSGTNLSEPRGRQMSNQLLRNGYKVRVKLFHVGLEELLRRNATGPITDIVPPTMIERGHRVMLNGGPEWYKLLAEQGMVDHIVD